MQKENNPSKEEQSNTNKLKTMKISIVNNLVEETNAPNKNLSIQVDISKNMKIVSTHGSVDEFNSLERDIDVNNDKAWKEINASVPVVEKIVRNRKRSMETINPEAAISRRKEFDDYESPLQALGTAA